MPHKWECETCGHISSCQRDHNRHLNQKISCGKRKFVCECGDRFKAQKGLNYHKKHVCQGVKVTVETQNKHIEDLKTIIKATGAIGETVNHNITNVNNVNGNNYVVTGDQITNVQNNIIVLPAGKENVDYIKSMLPEELKRQIGMTPDPSTMTNLFKILRVNEEHPENHTLLLPDIDSKTVHQKTASGWAETAFDERIRSLIHHDYELLDRCIKRKDRDESFYWNYLVRDVLRKCGEVDHVGLKPIYDSVRILLHDLTKSLADKFNDGEESSADTRDAGDEELDDLDLQEIDINLKILKLEALKVKKIRSARSVQA